MKFLTLTLFLFALSISLNSFSQVARNTTLSDGFAPVTTLTTAGKSLFVPLKIQTKTHYLPLSYWSKKNTVGFDISEVAFVNWNAGGTSSISGLLKGKFIRDYTQINYKWSNELIFRYGMNKQDGKDLKKTDDALQFNSTFGYRKDSLTNWYHSAKFNFNTQFMNGYAYPNTSKAISKPFAPAYIFMGVGAENINNEKKRIFYISPFTFKTTFVLDQKLADQGAFGVEKATYDLDGNLLTHGEK